MIDWWSWWFGGRGVHPRGVRVVSVCRVSRWFCTCGFQACETQIWQHSAKIFVRSGERARIYMCNSLKRPIHTRPFCLGASGPAESLSSKTSRRPSSVCVMRTKTTGNVWDAVCPSLPKVDSKLRMPHSADSSCSIADWPLLLSLRAIGMCQNRRKRGVPENKFN